jgi:undecaprenyl-diphosphatase
MATENDSVKNTTDSEEPSAQLGRFEQWDRRAMLFLYGRFRNPVFDLLMPFMSVICNKGALHVVAGTLLIVCGYFARRPDLQRAGVALMAAAGSAGLIAELPIKYFWRRKRPFMVMDGVLPKVPHKRLLRRPSFPSGHASGYFAGAAALSVCYPALSVWFFSVAAIGAFSRIYNGVHFPTDVLAGSAIGAAFGYAVTPLLLPLLEKVF